MSDGLERNEVLLTVIATIFSMLIIVFFFRLVHSLG